MKIDGSAENRIGCTREGQHWHEGYREITTWQPHSTNESQGGTAHRVLFKAAGSSKNKKAPDKMEGKWRDTQPTDNQKWEII